jgi:hypothetical protein
MDQEQWVKRNRQWRRFHEWEKTLPLIGSLESRIHWFSEAWEMARELQGGRSTLPSDEKIERLRKLRYALAKIEVP